MRHFAILSGLCLCIAMFCSPLAAAQNNTAQGSAAHQTMLTKAKKSKPKFKPHKAPKRHARKVNRAN